MPLFVGTLGNDALTPEKIIDTDKIKIRSEWGKDLSSVAEALAVYCASSALVSDSPNGFFGHVEFEPLDAQRFKLDGQYEFGVTLDIEGDAQYIDDGTGETLLNADVVMRGMDIYVGSRWSFNYSVTGDSAVDLNKLTDALKNYFSEWFVNVYIAHNERYLKLVYENFPLLMTRVNAPRSSVNTPNSQLSKDTTDFETWQEVLNDMVAANFGGMDIYDVAGDAQFADWYDYGYTVADAYSIFYDDMIEDNDWFFGE